MASNGNSLGVLGEPVTFAEHGLQVVETDSQGCCRWVVRVPSEPLGYEQEPLPGIPARPDEPGWADPPVWIADMDDPEAQLALYADSFSAYVLTSEWDAGVWDDASAEFDHLLKPDVLDWLRERFTELPTTYAWADNQGCDATYRFDGPAKILIAVGGGIALYSVVHTDDPQLLAEIRTVLG
ncbi:hypothetical protein BXY51_008250 [Actinoplanes cyaneus]|nr:hypothetical protein [Actinoplanes cyaneus]